MNTIMIWITIHHTENLCASNETTYHRIIEQEAYQKQRGVGEQKSKYELSFNLAQEFIDRL